MCLMALGNNDVSDDSSSNDESDVETDEISEMMTLLHNQQEYLTKQNEEIKALKSKEKLHASFVSRYENLLNKFNLLDNEHKELKMKYESLESKSESSSDKSFPCNIPCAISFDKVDASTSCDLTPCNENVIVETCDDLIAKENDELKQEIERLMTDLRRLKGKYTQEQVQPSQDNTSAGVKKLEKGETVTCFKCHKEGHKSYQCKEKEGQAKGKENGKPKNLNKSKKGHKKAKEIKKNTSPYLKASLVYTKPTHKFKQKSNRYILKKKENGKVVAHAMGWRHQGWNWPIWVPKEIINTMDGSQRVWVPKT